MPEYAHALEFRLYAGGHPYRGIRAGVEASGKTENFIHEPERFPVFIRLCQPVHGREQSGIYIGAAAYAAVRAGSKRLKQAFVRAGEHKERVVLFPDTAKLRKIYERAGTVLDAGDIGVRSQGGRRFRGEPGAAWSRDFVKENRDRGSVGHGFEPYGRFCGIQRVICRWRTYGGGCAGSGGENRLTYGVLK